MQNLPESGRPFVWCGAVLNYEGLQTYRGETPAASQWSKGLLQGVQDHGTPVVGFAPVWDSLFPKGRLFPGDTASLDRAVPQALVRYVNLPSLRPATITLSLERKIQRFLRSGVKPVALVNYNPYPYYCKALEGIARRYPDIPWINIVLDLDDPLADNWAAFTRATRASRGSVFLSWWGYCHAPVERKLHLDGGWSGSLPEPLRAGERVFVYAGKFAGYGGIQEIIDAIREFPRKDVYFDFYGKGRSESLEALAAADPRVRLRGFVPDEVLAEACRRAIGFLSPRDQQFQGTRMIFPSKLLFYLKFRKPVIGPLLPGLAPEYGPVLVQPADSSPGGWASAMERVAGFGEEELAGIAARIQALLERKTWSYQAEQLLAFINNLE